MNRINVFFLFIILTLFLSCQTDRSKDQESVAEEQAPTVSLDKLEPYRPLFHFTPAENWINDPNGLVYLNGEYHLFYQYNPYGNTWGHMSWGHAVSADLIHWLHLPVALYEEAGTMIFSGSAVVDHENTSGLCTDGKPCLIAIYTSHVEGKVQHQSIAYSQDQGRTWEKYKNNPVLDLGKKDFRDPKVFWYEPEDKWVMVVSIPLEYRVQFYQSDNLVDWELTGAFGGQGDVSKIWECPDLLQVPVENTDKKKWVLIISSGSPYGDFTGMQYFTGEFDGKEFIRDDQMDEPQWLDYGKDFYAAITYNNLPAEVNPVLVGWVNNWRYANSIPTSPWRGMMSIPRELTLREVNGKYSLIQRPVSSFYQYISKKQHQKFEAHMIGEDDNLLDDLQAGSFMVSLVFENIDAEEFGLEVMKGGDEKTVIGYNVGEEKLFIDRKESGNIVFHDFFSSIEKAPVALEENRLSLDILVDRSVVEVFARNGYRVITDQIFPENEESGLQLYVKNGQARVISLNFFPVSSFR